MKVTEVKCPICGHLDKIEIQDVIEVHQEPGLKVKINSFDLFNYHCDACQQSIPIVYPVLYHDIEKKLMIYFNAELSIENPEMIDEFEDRIEKEYGTLSGYTKRFVSDPDTLKEKILICDLNLDDRVIEILKAYYIARVMDENPSIQLKQVVFSQRDGKNAFVFISENNDVFATELQQLIYERLGTIYQERIVEFSHDDFMLVNLEWAYRVIDQKN